MTKTSNEVCTRALRMIGVGDVGETLAADDVSFAQEAMQAILDELEDVHGVSVAWGIEEVPDALLLPFAEAVAADVAPTYGKAGPPRSRALLKMKASLARDDREDPRDISDNGTVDSDEEDAGKRAAYY